MTLLAIARNAFLESIRQPIFAVLLIVGILAMVLNVSRAPLPEGSTPGIDPLP